MYSFKTYTWNLHGWWRYVNFWIFSDTCTIFYLIDLVYLEMKYQLHEKSFRHFLSIFKILSVKCKSPRFFKSSTLAYMLCIAIVLIPFNHCNKTDSEGLLLIMNQFMKLIINIIHYKNIIYTDLIPAKDFIEYQFIIIQGKLILRVIQQFKPNYNTIPAIWPVSWSDLLVTRWNNIVV